MADYSGAYWSSDDKTKAIMSERRIEELREGYVTVRNTGYASYHCIRCGCVVGDRKVHDGVCPWSEEMLQAGLEKLNKTGEL